LVSARPSDFLAFKSKLDKEIKIYLNICTHQRVRGPLTSDGENVPIKEVDKW